MSVCQNECLCMWLCVCKSVCVCERESVCVCVCFKNYQKCPWKNPQYVVCSSTSVRITEEVKKRKKHFNLHFKIIIFFLSKVRWCFYKQLAKTSKKRRKDGVKKRNQNVESFHWYDSFNISTDDVIENRVARFKKMKRPNLNISN